MQKKQKKEEDRRRRKTGEGGRQKTFCQRTFEKFNCALWSGYLFNNMANVFVCHSDGLFLRLSVRLSVCLSVCLISERNIYKCNCINGLLMPINGKRGLKWWEETNGTGRRVVAWCIEVKADGSSAA